MQNNLVQHTIGATLCLTGCQLDVKMKISENMLAVMLIASTTLFVSVSAHSCKACNCQFNNVQVLNDMVEAKVNQILANEPRKLHYDHAFIP